jgi:FKBP-type peptidyl-prolyl cis-trans isomerase
MTLKNYTKALLLMVAVVIMSLYSCNPAKQYEKEEASAINDYLSKNPDLDFELKSSGLYYYDMEVGTGRTPVTHDTAYVMYTAKLLNGRVFDTNVDTNDTLIFAVDEGWMIQGLDEGITYMKGGGKALLLIPSSLAYGPTGYYTIGGYTPLLFEIYLVRVAPGPGK